MINIVLFLMPLVVTILVMVTLVKQSRTKVPKVDIKEYIKTTEITKNNVANTGRETTTELTVMPVKSKTSYADLSKLKKAVGIETPNLQQSLTNQINDAIAPSSGGSQGVSNQDVSAAVNFATSVAKKEFAKMLRENRK